MANTLKVCIKKKNLYKRDTGNKGGMIILRSGNRKKTITVGSLMRDFNLTTHQASFLLLYFHGYNRVHGTLTLDDYENLTKADIYGILGI